MIIRPAAQGALALIWEFPALADYEPDVAAVRESPFVPAHLDDGQRPSDFGVVAEIGGAAARARSIPAEANPFHIDERSPVVTIAVRGEGVGETWRALLEAAAARCGRLSLEGR